MRAALALAVLIAAAPAVRAWSEPPPPRSPAAAPSGLFGEREPGEDDEAAQSGRRLPSETAPTPEAYDARVRASAEAARALAGPLDGGWTLTAENEGAVFDLRFIDENDRLEAVWRDRRRPNAIGASGAVDEVKRFGERVTLKFASRAGVEDFVSLAPARGGWTGELTEAGKTRAVWMARNSP